MTQMTIERSKKAGREIIRVAGEIDMANASELEDALAQLASTGCPVSIDMANLTFIDSFALHALQRFVTSTNGAGPVWIENPRRMVLKTMEIVGLTELPQLEIRLTFMKEGRDG